MKCTYVTYLDHEVRTKTSWMDADDAVEAKLEPTPAMGMIVGESKDLLILTVSQDGGQAITPFRILKKAIVTRIDFDHERLLSLLKGRQKA